MDRFKRYLPLRVRGWWHWQIEQRWIMSRFNKRAIRPGDFYENCNYHPMLCSENNYGDLEGVSLVDGSIRCCSAFHCGPIKFADRKEAQVALDKYLADVAASKEE